MNIPSRVNPFGYDNTVPPGYVRAEFLRGTGNQYIDTGVVKTGAFNVSITFSNPTARCTGWGYSYAVDSVRYQSHDELQGDGRYIRFCYENVSIYPFPPYDGYTPLEKHTMVFNTGKRPLTIDGESVAVGLSSASKYDISNPLGKSNYLFAVNGLRNEPYLNIYAFSTWDDGKGKDIDLIPSLDPSGVPCMYDTVTGQPFRNSGSGADFIAGLTTKQAISLANLPATGGSLTISIPLEAAFDANVQSALNAAADKGWTITVQYRESELTTKNIDADFLEGTGTQYIDTRIVPSDETGLRLTALTTSDTDTIPFGSRTSNETESRFYAVRPRRLSPGTIDRLIANGFGWGGWVIIGENPIQGVPKKEETYLNWLNARSAISAYAAKYLLPLPFTPELSMYLFAANIDNTAQLYYIGRIWAASVSIGTQLKANFIPVIDSSGIPCMHDTVSGQNFYNANTTGSDFIVGFDTTEKAAISMSKLPVTTGGTLTVSLPVAAQDTDTLVPAAIGIATNRGWTIITQYRED